MKSLQSLFQCRMLHPPKPICTGEKWLILSSELEALLIMKIASSIFPISMNTARLASMLLPVQAQAGPSSA